MAVIANRIKGFADMYPPQSSLFTRMENTAREIFSRYGFVELRTPVLEYTDLFKRSIGEETDVVQKEMFTFPDRKGRMMTMRPEATAGVMRAYVEDARYSRESVSRLFTTGPMFRYERPQKGRMRQFHQINCECLGSHSPYADADLIIMLTRFLTALGLKDLTLKLNSLGCAHCRPLVKQALVDYLHRQDCCDQLCEDCTRRMETNPLRVLDCKQEKCRCVTDEAPRLLDYNCPECKEHFDTVLRLLDAAGVKYEIDHRLATLQLRGVKGTTGTQASFMELFKGDADKIRAVDASIAEEMGFDCEAVIPVSGQTYSRKVDAFILNALAGIGQSCMKFATDLRLLANFKEMEEPFEKNQIGSSAMPYKRNPMRCERICALSRYLMVDVLNPSFTTGTQWFERTLDDSANKRVAMTEGFLATDAILNIMLNVTDGLVVYPKVVRSRLMAELPFMASENIMMQAVEKGGNRQELHERLRQHAIAAGKQVKEEGLPNDMVDRIAADPAFGLTKEEITAGLVPENFVGRAPQQVEEFIAHILKPIFDANPDAVEQHANLSV